MELAQTSLRIQVFRTLELVRVNNGSKRMEHSASDKSEGPSFGTLELVRVFNDCKANEIFFLLR